MKYFLYGILIYFLIRFFKNLYAFSNHSKQSRKTNNEPEIILTKKDKAKFVPSDVETIPYKEINDDE